MTIYLNKYKCFSYVCIGLYKHLIKYVLLGIDKYLKQCYTFCITMRKQNTAYVKV